MVITTTTDVILYYAGQQLMASPLAQIQSVQHCDGPITPIPGAPNWLSGIISISGELLSLLHLADYLLPSAQQSDKPTTLLICQLSHQRYGVLVSRCTGRFSAQPIKQTATDEPEHLQPYVTQKVQVNHTICPLVDLAAFCADPRITENSAT